MHILIVDDEPLAREELNYLVSQHEEVTSTSEAESVEEAMESIMDQKPAIIFLDIHLTDETGFDLAEKLMKLKNPPYLIFATAYDNYALKAFKVNAKDYILKPFDEKDIHESLNKALSQLGKPNKETLELTSTTTPDVIPISVEDRIFLIHPKDIYLVSIDDKVLSIHTKDDVYHTSGSLGSIEKKLPAELFFKTHRSYILNTSRIQEIQPWFNHTLQIVLDNGLKVPVSRSYVKEFKIKFGIC